MLLQRRATLIVERRDFVITIVRVFRARRFGTARRHPRQVQSPACGQRIGGRSRSTTEPSVGIFVLMSRDGNSTVPKPGELNSPR